MKRKQGSFDSSKIEVKSSKIHGRGVFAKNDFQKGETIEVAPTIILNSGDSSLLSYTKLCNYFFGEDYSETMIGLGYSSLYNHSDTPNADFLLGNELIVIIAEKEIKKGEEILIDYGWDEEQAKELKSE